MDEWTGWLPATPPPLGSQGRYLLPSRGGSIDGRACTPWDPFAARMSFLTKHLPCRIQSFCLPRYRIGSATSTTIDFGAILPFTVVPAYNLPVYASQWPLPDIPQDLVRGCELGFAAVSISGN